MIQSPRPLSDTRGRVCCRAAAAAIIVVVLASFAFAVQDSPEKAQAPEFNLEPRTHVVFAYGDVRFTDPAACDLSDQTYRTALIDRMAHGSDKPDFLIITGDVVLAGDNDHDWNVFDRETKPLRDEH